MCGIQITDIKRNISLCSLDLIEHVEVKILIVDDQMEIPLLPGTKNAEESIDCP
jgi:hypothetical protein